MLHDVYTKNCFVKKAIYSLQTLFIIFGNSWDVWKEFYTDFQYVHASWTDKKIRFKLPIESYCE